MWQRVARFKGVLYQDFPAGASGAFTVADICYLRFIGDAQGTSYSTNLWPSATLSNGQSVWNISIAASATSGVGVMCFDHY